ncbi:hypothetical protein Tco_0185760, partial [Tanacetum coccineum]
HKLNVRKGCPPVRQKKRGQAAERNIAINDEEGSKRDTVVGIVKESGVHSNFTSWSFVYGGIKAWQLRIDFLGNKIFSTNGIKVFLCLQDILSYPMSRSLVGLLKGSKLCWKLRGSVKNRLCCMLAIPLRHVFSTRFHLLPLVSFMGHVDSSDLSLLCYLFLPSGSLFRLPSFPLSFRFFTMSKRNLATVTCSLAQNALVDFVKEYGIPWCYDPKLPTLHQTVLDAPEGYIPLHLSRFTIGNLHFPLNDFCLDVFKIFQCHFPLLNPFGVARITTFAVACKAYGGEAFVHLFRAFLTVGPAGDWLMSQKRHGSDISHLFGNSISNIPSWKSEFIFVKETLISDLHPNLITDFCHGQGSFTYPYPKEPFDEVLWNRLRLHTLEA